MAYHIEVTKPEGVGVRWRAWRLPLEGDPPAWNAWPSQAYTYKGTPGAQGTPSVKRYGTMLGLSATLGKPDGMIHVEFEVTKSQMMGPPVIQVVDGEFEVQDLAFRRLDAEEGGEGQTASLEPGVEVIALQNGEPWSGEPKDNPVQQEGIFVNVVRETPVRMTFFFTDGVEQEHGQFEDPDLAHVDYSLGPITAVVAPPLPGQPSPLSGSVEGHPDEIPVDLPTPVPPGLYYVTASAWQPAELEPGQERANLLGAAVVTRVERADIVGTGEPWRADVSFTVTATAPSDTGFGVQWASPVNCGSFSSPALGTAGAALVNLADRQFVAAGRHVFAFTYLDDGTADRNAARRWCVPKWDGVPVRATAHFEGAMWKVVPRVLLERAWNSAGQILIPTPAGGQWTFLGGRPTIGVRGGLVSVDDGTRDDLIACLREDDVFHYAGHNHWFGQQYDGEERWVSVMDRSHSDLCTLHLTNDPRLRAELQALTNPVPVYDNTTGHTVKLAYLDMCSGYADKLGIDYGGDEPDPVGLPILDTDFARALYPEWAQCVVGYSVVVYQAGANAVGAGFWPRVTYAGMTVSEALQGALGDVYGAYDLAERIQMGVSLPDGAPTARVLPEGSTVRLGTPLGTP